MKLNLLPQASWRALQGARGMRAGISDCLEGLGGGAGAWGGVWGGASCSRCWEEKWPQATDRSQGSLALGGTWSRAFNGWRGPVVLAAPLLPGD